jgi:alpha-glucosidase
VPLEKPAIFVRAGSVIPMQMPGSCTRDAPSGPLELHVYAGGENAGGFAYYEDDGESLDYEKGAFLRRLIRFSGKELVLGPVRGSFDSRFQTLKVLLHGFDPIPGIRLNAESVSLKAESVRFFEPVSPFSRDGNAADPYGELAVQTLEAPHLRTEMRFGIQDPPEP